MQLENQDSNNVTLKLGERFDFACVEEFRKCYESLEPQGRCLLVMDFANTKYMDSSALGMLINAKNHFSGQSVKIMLRNCNAQIRKIFSISRFDLKFDIL
ncbi:STAS domain-containing protein [Agaribacterium haliotis]|uniref:STAS domain-containing protein n=1 Tax=Agaribacterium haliotis TaxID=2013869 RepID=UPI000BB59F24|nr:STAS domain-containing protein [Agaribacterium haliotis]